MIPDNKSPAALIDALSAEHRALLPELARLAQEASASAESLKTAVERIAPLIGLPLDEHIATEDRELFPAYAARGGDAGILAFFTAEHVEILAIRNRLLAAIEDNDHTEAVGFLAEQLADTLSSHMSREDEVLFPAMRDLL